MGVIGVASEPEALLAVLKNPAYHFKRIGLEAGPLSQWLFSALAEAELPVVCVETPHQAVPSCSKPSRRSLARAEHAARLMRRPTLTALGRAGVSQARIGTKKRTFRSNKETDEGKKMCPPCLNLLTKKAPYKGLGAESEEKREPARDIDIAAVDSLISA